MSLDLLSQRPPIDTVADPDDPDIYPDSDGKPMAENTLQWDWIATIKGGLENAFRDDPNIFVAGDLLWYPVKGEPRTRMAPDAMVALGRPKGYRGSYIQHREAGVAPQVAFEVLSPGNRAGEMRRKFEFYERFGVEEYYLFDPDRRTLTGWLREGDHLRPILEMEGYVSPRLGIRFELASGDLQIFGPDGHPFIKYVELAIQRDELAIQRDELAIQRDELARRVEDDRTRLERLEAQLRALGVEPGA